MQDVFSKKRMISYLCFIIVVACMIGAAECRNEAEIIFPEMAAIGLGIFVSPNRSWATDKKRIFLLISVAAAIGVVIVRFSPFGKVPQMILAYAISQVILIYSRTTFAPFVSAIVLPVMLGTSSVIYLIAAIVLTGFVLVITLVLEKYKIWDKGAYEKRLKPDVTDWGNAGIRILIVSVCIWLAIRTGCMYAVAPPLLVAFTEFMRPGGAKVKRAGKIVLVVTGCAACGSFFRWLFCVRLDLCLTLAGVCTILAVLVIVLKTKLFLPPAAALSILPMIIPEKYLFLYPIHVGIGICAYVLISILFTHREWIIPRKEM